MMGDQRWLTVAFVAGALKAMAGTPKEVVPTNEALVELADILFAACKVPVVDSAEAVSADTER